MSAETTKPRQPPQAAPPQSVVRLVEVRVTKPWRLSRRAMARRTPAAMLQGWAVAAVLLAAAPFPASAQAVWFDPDIPTDQVLWAEVPSDDRAADDSAVPCLHELVPAAIASLRATH